MTDINLHDNISKGRKTAKFTHEYVYNAIIKYTEENDKKPTIAQLANSMGELKDSIYAAVRKLKLTDMIDIDKRINYNEEKEKHSEWDNLPLRKGPITRKRILEKLNELRRINGLEELKE